MPKSDPFGFDMRVSSAKKKNPRGKRGMSGAFETSTRACEHPGCAEKGLYRAPRSPDHLDEYLWFCKDHVREYNLKWNFFNGQTEEEFDEQISKDKVWGRDTKPWATTPPATPASPKPAAQPADCPRQSAARSRSWMRATTGPRRKSARPTRL